MWNGTGTGLRSASLAAAVGALFLGMGFSAAGRAQAPTSATPAPASVPPVETGYSYPLFDGKTLQGWTVTGCKAEVVDGAIALLEGDGFVRTERRFKDFVLELDWKPRRTEKFDSGLYIRSEAPPEGKPWPNRWQINLKEKDSGDLLGKSKLPGAATAAKGGEWNHIKVIAVGKSIRVEVNGVATASTDDFETPEGYIGFQAEVPGGGQYDFKNIQITEVGAKSLFNGKDLTGWAPASAGGECWSVDDGAIHCSGKKGSWLRSDEKHGDFSLRLQYRIQPNGNSGIYVHVPADGNHHGKDAGFEVQILDDHAEKFKNLRPDQFAGSIYGVKGTSQHVGRPAGEWNELELIVRGKGCRVIHNGVEVLTASEADTPLLAERLAEGFLGFQNHGGKVWYRYIRIEKL